jgi:hypothetical protein
MMRRSLISDAFAKNRPSIYNGWRRTGSRTSGGIEVKAGCGRIVQPRRRQPAIRDATHAT